MKNIKYLLLFIFTVTVIFGCNKDEEKETYGISRITEYPVFTLSGETTVYHQLGTTYVDPGASATSNGEDVPVTTLVTGRFTGYSGTEVPTNVVDEYSVIYSAVNTDGLEGTGTRTVMVFETGDMVGSLAGLYSCLTTRDGTTYNPINILIWEVSTDVYGISLAYGGRYSDGLSYGDVYAFIGAQITVNDMGTNDFTITEGVCAALGRTAQMSSFIVNSTTKTITFSSIQNVGYPVTCMMTQQ